VSGLNTNFGQIINIRLRPASAPNSFFDMHVLMDTMLHELCHNVHSEHDKQFYGLLDQIKQEYEMLSSKGYQGEGFFSQGQRLGTGHVFYKPSISTVASADDRKRIKSAAERRARGDMFTGQGRRLGDGGPITNGERPRPAEPVGVATAGGRRLGRLGVDEGEIFELDIDPKQLAAMAAQRRANDQKSCGAKQAGADMRRETERAQREGTTTQAGDLGNIIDLDDLQDYDLGDIPAAPTPPTHSRSPPPAKSGDSFNSSQRLPSTSTGATLNSDWTCQKCTLQNPPLYLSCQACQTERKLEDEETMGNNYIDLTEEFAVSWDCKLCTFKNENVTDGKCVVCGTEI
jgi:DNA-dependent metalloprotease WSS1